MNPTVPGRLVPPRPNLGPEPWSETPPSWTAYFGLALLFVLSCAALYSVRRHRRNARGKGEKRQVFERPDATPRERLIGLSGSLRVALTDRFGASYRARTIEELAADGQVGELLGGEPFDQLIRFLDQIDQLKFAPVRTPAYQETLQAELAEWEPQVKNLILQIRARPAGKSAPKRIRHRWGLARPRRLESERR